MDKITALADITRVVFGLGFIYLGLTGRLKDIMKYILSEKE